MRTLPVRGRPRLFLLSLFTFPTKKIAKNYVCAKMFECVEWIAGLSHTRK
jgi:hypothetical protein